jgi:HK97 family phage portal protein
MAWWNPRSWGKSPSPEVHTRMINAFGGFELAVNGGYAAQPSATWAYRGALSIPGVWRAATLISDTVAALPQKAYKDIAGGLTETVPSMLLDQPSHPHTRIETWSSLILDLVMNGNAVAIIAARDEAGTPTALIPIPACSVGVRRNEYGELEYSYSGRTYTPNEILHIRGPHQPGDLRGYGVLELHLRTLNLAENLTEQAQDIGKGVPSGVLKSQNPDLTADEAADLKLKWLESQRNRTVAVLNSSTEFEPLAWNPTDAQLLETRKFNLVEIALIFGIPPHFLAAENGSGTYTNVQQEALSLVKYSLQGVISRIEQALSQLLPYGTRVKLSLDALLRADTLARYQAHSLALTSGWITPNEVRALEDLPPMPGGDEPYRKATTPDVQTPAPGDQVNPNE